jgi:hypothetical protein
VKLTWVNRVCGLVVTARNAKLLSLLLRQEFPFLKYIMSFEN